jgi:hypothetical protein
MSDRVAVYIDFDNVVISRYDNLHGDGAWRKDMARDHRRSISSNDPIDVKLAEAEVDLGAIIDYAELPGITPAVIKKPEPAKQTAAAKKTTAKKSAKKTEPPPEPDAQTRATALLERAIRVGLQKSDDEWVYAGGVKSQMQRMDPAFKEKSLGFSSFRAFVESRAETVESKVDGNGQLMVRLP